MAKKHMLACEKMGIVIISDQIAQTECEMAIFVLKNVEQKGPSEEEHSVLYRVEEHYFAT